MNVTYTELIEEDESYYDLGDEYVISGHIDANDKLIVRYFAYWKNEYFPVNKITFDIIFFHIDKFKRSVPTEAISVSDTGLSHLYFNDAASRPFAHGQAKHCIFPQPSSASGEDFDDFDEIDDPSDMVCVAASTVNFIYKHDTRLRGCFG